MKIEKSVYEAMKTEENFCIEDYESYDINKCFKEAWRLHPPPVPQDREYVSSTLVRCPSPSEGGEDTGDQGASER